MYLSMPTSSPISPEILLKTKKMRMDINETIIVKVQSLDQLNKKCKY